MTCRVKRQRGVALIVAMLVFALATSLVVAMSSEFTLFLKRGANSFIGEQANAYLRGGEDLAALVLRQDLEQDATEQQQRDDLTEIWAQQVPPYALDEGGWLVGRLEDLQGRFNLNSVAGQAPQGKRFTAAQAQFVRLLQALGEPQVSEQDAVLIAEALMDWLDENREPRDFGAEDDYYYDMSPSYRAANSPLASVSELRLVAYMTAEIYNAIAPFLTVWGNPGAAINIHTAPLAVLRSINSEDQLQPLGEVEAQELLSIREEEGFESVQALLEGPVFAGREISPGLRARLGENSSVFLYLGEVEVADRVARLYSVLLREEGRIHALVRSSGSI
jgi:general secretion pathway protein K